MAYLAYDDKNTKVRIERVRVTNRSSRAGGCYHALYLAVAISPGLPCVGIISNHSNWTSLSELLPFYSVAFLGQLLASVTHIASFFLLDVCQFVEVLLGYKIKLEIDHSRLKCNTRFLISLAAC